MQLHCNSGLSCLKFGASGLSRVQIRLHAFQPPSSIILWPIMLSFPHFLNVFTTTLLPLPPVSMAYHIKTKPGQSKYTAGMSIDGSVLKTKLLTGERKWTFARAMFCAYDINGARACTITRIPLRGLCNSKLSTVPPDNMHCTPGQ